MGKMLSKYQKAIAGFEAGIALHVEKADEKYRHFISMVAEDKKGEIRVNAIKEIGPLVVYMAVDKLDSGFTFEELLAEVDRVLGEGEEK